MHTVTRFSAVSRTIVILFSLALAACAGRSGPAWTYAPLAGSQRPATAEPSTTVPAATPSAVGGAPVGSLEIRAFDLGFELAAPGVEVTGLHSVTLDNEGALPHDITFDDGTTLFAGPGETINGEVDVPAGGLGFICSIPGHADAGMTGRIEVTGTSGTPDPAASPSQSPDDHGGPTPQADIEPDLNAPAPIRMNPEAPPLATGETHDIELVMTERLMTVAEGFQQAVWTFGDTVPGPVIRVKVGDLVRVHLINPAENQLSHSIDFHASLVAWNDEMRSIAPGEELIYEFTAQYAGVWMYHCGTSPALHHIANGMYGMVIVEPVGGLEPVEHEFAFVQSEWYLGPQGQPSSLAKASAAAPAPDFVVFNGVANQYADGPIEIPTGERVRAFVLNAGPSVDSSYHIVGTIFDSVVKEGVELAAGNPGSWGAQAMDLSPAQGGIVEFTFAEDGMYPMVTHAFNFVGRGALGLFQAGDGIPNN